MSHLSGLGLALLLVSTIAGAQVQPMPGEGDPHLQAVDYSAGQIVQLRSAPGYQLMVELSPDEQVQSVALGDSAAWQVNVSKSGDRLFLKPATSDTTTNMTVVTSVRVYNFDLIAMSGDTPDMPYTVQFRYPVSVAQIQDARFGESSAALRRESSYRMSGDRLLRPLSVTDDGHRTYIVWPKESPIPAVYAPDGLGNEALVNGMMGADDVYVVDGAPKFLTFRIDGSVAHAERVRKTRRRR
ncbi:MAG: TrbG/VirB9 family P-type conjugative transfer protein [Sphingomicrobium sp.]